jgi:hypothetical protein
VKNWFQILLSKSQLVPLHPGSDVTFIEAMPKIMPGFDAEIAKQAERILITPRNIDYRTDVLATKVRVFFSFRRRRRRRRRRRCCCCCCCCCYILQRLPEQARVDLARVTVCRLSINRSNRAAHSAHVYSRLMRVFVSHACDDVSYWEVIPGIPGEKPVTIELSDFKTREVVDTMEVDACLVATGRAPYTEGLNLEVGGCTSCSAAGCI